jgi:hypothetical protein
MNKVNYFSLVLLITLLFSVRLSAQYPVFKGCPAEIDFSKTIREWDGFGFNYVETAQTIDYKADARDYGGFSIIKPQDSDKIIDLVFGKDGLKVGIVKMFLDPFHQTEPGGKFDHETSTRNMRMFVRMGLEKTRSRGSDLKIITTLYGPPPFMTLQKTMRGRDLDPVFKSDLANYLIDWVKFLKGNEKFPVKFISLHNEGEDWERWPWDGKEGNIGKGHDYNMYWPPAQVADFLGFMQPMLDREGLKDVSVTNGEPTNWYRFSFWGFPEAIEANPDAMKNIGLITSHGFYNGSYDNRWYGSHTPKGINYLQAVRPELHAWVTSTSWSKMDSRFIREIWGNIYESGVNGLIPWAGIQRPPLWTGGDPNPGCAILVSEDGSYELQPGYYFYKQVSRAGQPGMKVAFTTSMDSELPIMAFSGQGTDNHDAFVIINTNLTREKPVSISVRGTLSSSFRLFRTSGQNEKYKEIGVVNIEGGSIVYIAPPNSVSTFFAE